MCSGRIGSSFWFLYGVRLSGWLDCRLSHREAIFLASKRKIKHKRWEEEVKKELKRVVQECGPQNYSSGRRWTLVPNSRFLKGSRTVPVKWDKLWPAGVKMERELLFPLKHFMTDARVERVSKRSSGLRRHADNCPQSCPERRLSHQCKTPVWPAAWQREWLCSFQVKLLVMHAKSSTVKKRNVISFPGTPGRDETMFWKKGEGVVSWRV